MVSRWHVQTPSRTRIEFIFFRRIFRLSILRFETIPTFLPTFHQFSASVLFQTSRVFCKSCTSVLQAFRECFSGFFNESTIFFRVALPSKAAEDFSTIRDKFIRGWQIFFHRSDRNRKRHFFSFGTHAFSSNFDDFLIFSTKYARQEMIKFTNYIKYLFPIFTHGFPFRGNLATGQHLLQHHRVQDGVSLIRSYPSYSTFNYLTDSQEVEHD